MSAQLIPTTLSPDDRYLVEDVRRRFSRFIFKDESEDRKVINVLDILDRLDAELIRERERPKLPEWMVERNKRLNALYQKQAENREKRDETERRRGPKPDWLRAVASNIQRGHTLLLEMETEHFAIVKFPPHRFWSSMLNPHKYAPVSYYLVRKDGRDLGRNPLQEEVWEGRLTKVGREKVAARLEEAESATPEP